jgi:hypothetical protein
MGSVEPVNHRRIHLEVPVKHRTLAVAGLVAAPLLAVLSVLLQPDLPSSPTDRLAAIDAAGWRAAVSAAAFAVEQLPTIAAALAIGHLLRARSPRLGSVGATLLVAGCVGHAVFGGYMLTLVAAAGDPAHRSAYAQLVDTVESSPMMLFSVVGLAGTVLGLLLLSVGLFRAHVGPRWVGPALWAFLVVEFVGTSMSDSASYLAGLLYLAAFGALAVQARRAWDGEPVVREPVSV